MSVFARAFCVAMTDGLSPITLVGYLHLLHISTSTHLANRVL